MEYHNLTQYLNKNGYTIEQIGDKRQTLVKMRPEAQLREYIANRLIKLQSLLALTPTTRAKYANLNTATANEEENEMLSIIGEYPEPAPLKDTKKAKR